KIEREALLATARRNPSLLSDSSLTVVSAPRLTCAGANETSLLAVPAWRHFLRRGHTHQPAGKRLKLSDLPKRMRWSSPTSTGPSARPIWPRTTLSSCGGLGAMSWTTSLGAARSKHASASSAPCEARHRHPDSGGHRLGPENSAIPAEKNRRV